MDGTPHANNFGTDEFIEFCRAQASEALITANFGTGTLHEAKAWQAVSDRRQFPVRFWEIGNEIYLAESRLPAVVAGNDYRIFKTSSQYSTNFIAWARALREVDNTVLVGAIAGTYNTSAENRGWIDTLLATAGKDIDFIALHNSFAPLILDRYDYSSDQKRRMAYSAMTAQAAFAGDDSQAVRQQLLLVRPEGQGRIAITEHFPLFGLGDTPDQLLAVLDQSRTLASALYTARLFHSYVKKGVWMANYNVAISPWLGALLTDTPSGLVKTPTYYIYELYRNHFGTTAVNVEVASPVYTSSQVGCVPTRTSVPYLDAIASRDSAGHLYLAVINNHDWSAVESTVVVSGLSATATAQVITITGPSGNAINGAGLTSTTAPSSISPQASTWTAPASGLYSFPPRSVTILKW